MTYEMKCLPGNEPRIEVTKDFVERNNLKINSAVALDIALYPRDTFMYMDLDVADTFLSFDEGNDVWSDEYRKEIENGMEHVYVKDTMEAAQDFLDYMVFAWMKAFDERAISACRSITKLSTWMEILGRNDVADTLRDERLFAPYGRPALRKACEVLGIDCPEDL